MKGLAYLNVKSSFFSDDFFGGAKLFTILIKVLIIIKPVEMCKAVELSFVDNIYR